METLDHICFCFPLLSVPFFCVLSCSWNLEPCCSMLYFTFLQEENNNTEADGPSSSVTHDADDVDVDDDDDDLDVDELNELEASLSRTSLQIKEPKDDV